MKKKTYEKPSMKVVMLRQQSHLLAGSPPVKDVPDDWNWGDPGDDR